MAIVMFICMMLSITESMELFNSTAYATNHTTLKIDAPVTRESMSERTLPVNGGKREYNILEQMNRDKEVRTIQTESDSNTPIIPSDPEKEQDGNDGTTDGSGNSGSESDTTAESGDEAKSGKSTMAISSNAGEQVGRDLSPNLGDFLTKLQMWELKDGKPVEIEGKPTLGGRYSVKLTFNRPDDQELLFRMAKDEELAALGIVPEDYEDGPWMYLQLSHDIKADVDSAKGDASGRVKIVNGVVDGEECQFILYHSNVTPVDSIKWALITFEGTLSEDANLEEVEIAVGSNVGTFTPGDAVQLTLKKEAVKYDPITHMIHYMVTVSNETENVVEGIKVTDWVKTKGATLVEGSIRIAGESSSNAGKQDGSATLAEDSIKIDEESSSNAGMQDGGCVLFYDPERTLNPGESLLIEYDVSVENLVKNLSNSQTIFTVKNEVGLLSGDPLGSKVTANASYDVDLGWLTKDGMTVGDFEIWDNEKSLYKYNQILRWDIRAYDPYLNFDDAEHGCVITDKLPDKLKIENLVGVYFSTADDDVDFKSGAFFATPPEGTEKTTLPTVQELLDLGIMSYEEGENTLTFNFPRLKKLSEQEILPGGTSIDDYFVKMENGGHLKVHIVLLTRYDDPPKGNGNYHNQAWTTLPSEIVKREDDHWLYVGGNGIDIRKTGKLNKDGKKLDYTVTMDVGAGLKTNRKESYLSGGAMIEDSMYIVGPADPDNPNNGEKRVYLDLSDAMKITSVVAEYTDEKGSPQEWKFEPVGWKFENYSEKFYSAEDEHRFGVFNVTENIYSKDQEEYNEYPNGRWKLCPGKADESAKYSSQRVLFFNPKIEPIPGAYWWDNTVYGEWPDELNKYDVKVKFNYTIDPEKAYFVEYDNTVWHYIMKSYAGCVTLADYLKQVGNVRVYNTAQGTVGAAHRGTDSWLDLTCPLEKSGEIKAVPSNSTRSAEYTVTFKNGANNDAAIPKDAGNIVFHDKFDPKMKYEEGSLYVIYKDPNGTKKVFNYAGGSPVGADNELIAPWENFVAQDGQTLQENFARQTGHYEYQFKYLLTAGENFSKTEVSQKIDNEAWVSFGEYETYHVNESLEMPTGVLTKGAKMEDGKVAFYVEINEQAAQLSPAGGKLTVVDEASDHEDLTLDAGSIRVERVLKDGSFEELKEGPDPDQYEKTVEPGETQENDKIALKVPDKMHLRVRYEYLLNPETTKGTVKITNNVSVSGIKEITTGGSFEFRTSDIDASSGGSSVSINLTKTRVKASEGDPEVKVPGAKFILYVPNRGELESSEAAAEEAASAIDMSVLKTKDNKELYPAAVYETNQEGTVKVNWKLLDNDVTYGLAEAYVPAGYVKLTKPVLFRIDRRDNANYVRVISENKSTDGDALTSADGDTLTIANEYKPGSAELKVSKTVVAVDKNGSPLENVTVPEKTFKFKLMDETGEVLDTAAVTGEGEAEFKPISYDTAGTRTYTITEVEENAAGWIYDKSVWNVKVEVEEKNGVLVTNTVYTKQDGTSPANSAQFTNRYVPDTVSVPLKVTKTVKGNPPADETFTFRLSEAGKKIGTTTVTGEGEAEFEPISYDAAGTHTYTITEVKGNAAGWTYDESVWNVTVKVTETDGKLSADVSYKKVNSSESGSSAAFTNIYSEPLGSLTIKKKIAGSQATDEDKSTEVYVFDVTGPDGYSSKVTITGEGDAKLNDLKPGEYNVTERDPEGKGDRKWTVSGEGSVTVEAGGEAMVTVTNTYGGDEEKETEPTNPSDETEPTSPSDETEPTSPSDETEPTSPSDETESTSPTEPTNPTNPTEPTGPSITDRPNNPTPSERHDPDEPSSDRPTTDIPERGVPLTQVANIPESPMTEIPDSPDVPLADAPDSPAPVTNIPDKQVPLDDVPRTGDGSRPFLWLFMMFGSVCGFAATIGKLLPGRKKEDEE